MNFKIQGGIFKINIFDEFFNYFGWEKGEYKAFMELVESANLKFRYIGYCFNDEQVAVIIE